MTDTLTPVLTDNWDADRAWTLAAYEDRGGYAALKKALAMDPDAVISAVKDSGLRGRGGAGFPTGMKWGFIPQDNPQAEVPRRQRRRVRAGHLQGHPADDGQPAHAGRGRDHQLATRSAPTRRSSTSAARCCTSSAGCSAPSQEAYAAGHLGKDIHGSGYDLDLVVHAGAGAYICGEETALLDSLEGRRGQPRLRPPFPAVAGLYASPTVINNVESIASVPSIIEQRRRAGSPSMGTEKSKGFGIFSPLRPRHATRASTRRRSASRCAS